MVQSYAAQLLAIAAHGGEEGKPLQLLDEYLDKLRDTKVRVFFTFFNLLIFDSPFVLIR